VVCGIDHRYSQRLRWRDSPSRMREWATVNGRSSSEQLTPAGVIAASL